MASPAPRPRILIADDTPLNRTLIASLLADSGVEVEEADDGRVAVERFTAGRYALVLLDLQMPVMGGLQAAREMRAIERDRGQPPTPLLAISANVDAEQRAEARAAGCNDLLARPLRRETLIGLIGGGHGIGGEAPPTLDPALLPLVPRLLAQLEASHAALTDACAVNDADGMRRAAHASRGNAQMFGALEVDRVLGGIEASAAEGRCEAERLAPLADAITTLRRQLGGGS